MKIAYSNLACPEWSMAEVFSNAARFGFDGVELRLYEGSVIPSTLSMEQQDTLVRLAKDHGIDIVGLGASTRFATPDAAVRQANVEGLLRFVEMAARMQVPMIRTFGGGLIEGGADEAAAVQWVAESLARVAPRAAELGVRVLLETHDEFSHSRMVKAVVEAVNNPFIGAIWDTHHPYRMGESVDETYRNLGSCLHHVHLKDARRRGDDWELVVFDEGEVPVRAIVERLVETGYDKYLSIEWERKWHPEIEAAGTALPKHLAILRGYLGGN